MKLRKNILFPSLLLTPIPILSVVSCSHSSNNQNKQIEQMKTILNNFIETNKDNLNENCVSPIYNDNSKTNLFNALIDSSIFSNYFTFNKTFKLNQEELDKRYILNFDFTYGIKDSFGKSLRPFISPDRTTITIPVLIYLIDTQSNIQVCKYINLFNLYVQKANVTQEEYQGSQGKELLFINQNTKTSFQAIPDLIIDKYFDFVITTTSLDYQKGPIYQSSSEELSKWVGKTLTEVKQISNAIKSPLDYNDKFGNIYTYSISDSYFNVENRRHATFIIKIELSKRYFSQLIDDAKNIFGLTFEKTYTYVDTSWNFELPSQSDINTYVENNKKILDGVKEEINSNIYLYAPTIFINQSEANELGVDEIIQRYKNGAKIVGAPSPFVLYLENGQERQISFEIDSIEKNESSTSQFKINVKIIIDKGDLSTFDTFTKIFDINSWKFV